MTPSVDGSRFLNGSWRRSSRGDGIRRTRRRDGKRRRWSSGKCAWRTGGSSGRWPTTARSSTAATPPSATAGCRMTTTATDPTSAGTKTRRCSSAWRRRTTSTWRWKSSASEKRCSRRDAPRCTAPSRVYPTRSYRSAGNRRRRRRRGKRVSPGKASRPVACPRFVPRSNRSETDPVIG